MESFAYQTININTIKFKAMRTKLFFVITMAFLASSCAKDLYVGYQTEGANTSTIVLKPSKATEKSNVTINDNLIVDRKKVKSITIKNVPAGDYTVNFTCESGWYKEKINAAIPVKSNGDGKTITKLIEVPPYSTGYWIYISACAIIPIILIGVSF